ncbi:MAG TPA: hypothetical protein VHJ83_09925 [Micromonosporaceae bacterium]|jgi:hypothetical protein|nr:hypothetical protein [Micromonosporaceae bacterium]
MRNPLLVLAAVAAAYLWWLVWPVLAVIAVAVFAVAVGAFVARLLFAAWRTFTPDHDDGPSRVPEPSGEPAYLRYLSGQVWRDLLVLLADVVAVAARPMVVLGAAATQLLISGWQAVALAPLWLAAVAGLLVAGLACAGLVVAVSAGYALVAGLASGLQLAAGFVVRKADELLVSARRTRPACPHPGCYRGFVRPEYGCPGCDTRHTDLVPGRHGVFRRVCRCGTRLPTSALLGRSRLASYCPHCHQSLVGAVGQAPLVHLPVVGGPGAGKTTYAHLALDALDGVEFTDESEAERFAGRLSALRDGQSVPRTAVELARATVLEMTLHGDRRCLLYLFDPPGEHYTTSERIAWQHYLDLATSLLLVVDPLSLDGVRRSLTPAEVASLSGVAFSTEDPAHVIDRLVGTLRTRPDGGRLDRVAVVVSKADALRRTRVGQWLVGGSGTDPVRDWLDLMGWGNPIRTLDRMAAEVRYFVSGLDVPARRIAEPVRWLMEGSLRGRQVYRLPRSFRPLDPVLSHLAPHQIPKHYRVLRRSMLAVVLALTTGGVTGLLGAVGVLGWRLIT